MLGGDGSIAETGKDVKEFLFGSLDVPLANLETSLQKYVGVLTILVNDIDASLFFCSHVFCGHRRLPKNLLILLLYPRKLSHSLSQRKRLRVKSQLV